MNDDEIRTLIRQTHANPEFPPSFQREVWARAAVAEQQSWTARWRQWCRFVLDWISHPAPALATIGVMLGAGILLGGLSTREDTEALRASYIVSIDPLTAAHSRLHE